MKKVAIVIGSIILLLAVVLFAIVMFINVIVEHTIEKYAPQYLGTQVSVDSVNLFLWQGAGIIDDLIIYNPPGYKSEYAIKIDEIRFKLALNTLFSNTVLINEIHIENPHIVYEKGILGKSNINTIVNYSGQSQSSSSSS